MFVVKRVAFDSDDGRSLTAAYHAESRQRFPADFDPTAGLPALQRDLVPPHGGFLVVYDAGIAIGCGGIKTLDDATGEIKHMFVRPSHRVRGVGSLILAELEGIGRELGLTSLRLDTSEYLSEAISLYRRNGYVQIEPYNSNHYATHWFEKHLEEPSGPRPKVSL